MMLSLVASSDFHGHLPEIPSCNLLILAGDICPSGPVDFQAKWMDTRLRNWLEGIPAQEIISVAGNHDKIFQKSPQLIPQGLRWRYLQDEVVDCQGLTIFGTPWQLPFYGAFNKKDEELKSVYAQIPQVDIIVSHGPPYKIGDEVPLNQHVGSRSLRQRILEIKPKLVICGHIHSGFGVYTYEGTTIVNVSLLNNAMQVAHKPVMFSIDEEKNVKESVQWEKRSYCG